MPNINDIAACPINLACVPADRDHDHLHLTNMKPTNTTRPSPSDAIAIQRNVLLPWKFHTSTHACIWLLDVAVDVRIDGLEC